MSELVNADVLRILDVNLNRAREALRVIEDHARFALNDADAAGAVKQARHALRTIADAAGADMLLAARDIVGDVGRDVKTASELTRSSGEDVVRAAFARLTEAARGLGEYGKLVAPEAAIAAERLRYDAYELEQRVILRGTLRRRFRAVRLYVLVTEALCRGAWLDVAAAALRGGAGCVQLREKGLSDREHLERARRLRDLATRHHALLAVNDRPDIARLAGADIVHLGQDDLAVREARRVAGARVLIGKSTHTLAQFEAALAERPDYLAVGPMFPSETKPQAHIAGLQTLTAARARTSLPLVAIGGISPANAAGVFTAGADCVAVCAGVISAENPEAAAAALAVAARESAHA